MTIQEQLISAAKNLTYYDECEGNATRAFRGHLETIAEKISALEAAGFEIKTVLDPRHMGSSKVYLSRNGITVELYHVFYDRFCRGFCDEKRRPLEERIELALKVAQMFAPIA